MNSSSLPAVFMGLLSFLTLTVAFILLKKALNRTGWDQKKQNRFFITSLIITLTWVVIIGLLAKRDFFADFSRLPPRPVIFMLLPLPFVVWFAFSKKFRNLAGVIPPHWLVSFQSFRIFVELLLWQGFVRNIIPVQMTFEGRNWDIISGALGALAGFVLMRKRKNYSLAIAYNFIGLGLLLNVLIIALLSMPTPLRYFMNEPGLDQVARFPMIYLPTVLVVLAYSFHIFSLRQLWLLKKEKNALLSPKISPGEKKSLYHA